jgi:hypothetical protein
MSSARKEQKADNIKKSSGDEKLDKLVADGTIKSVKTCCGNGVYNDHDLHIQLKNGTELLSHSTMISKYLAVKQAGQEYVRTTSDGGSAIFAMLSMFTKVDSKPAPKKMTYEKAPLGADNKPDSTARKTIEAAEFDTVFKSLPVVVQDVLNKRDIGGTGIQQVMVFGPGERVSPAKRM